MQYKHINSIDRDVVKYSEKARASIEKISYIVE